MLILWRLGEKIITKVLAVALLALVACGPTDAELHRLIDQQVQAVVAAIPTTTPQAIPTALPTSTPPHIPTHPPVATPVPTATPQPTVTPQSIPTPLPTTTPRPTATPQTIPAPLPTATPQPTTTPLPTPVRPPTPWPQPTCIEHCPRKQWADGTHLAYLTWYERGVIQQWSQGGDLCATRVLYDRLENWYQWRNAPGKGLCHYVGLFYGNDFLVDIDGTTYRAEEANLIERPE